MGAPLVSQKRAGEAIRRMHGVRISVHLGAQETPGERVIRIARHLDGPALHNLNQESARIGTIVGAHRPFDQRSHEILTARP